MSKQTSVELPNVHADNPVGKSVAAKRKRGRPVKQTRAKLDETVETASTAVEKVRLRNEVDTLNLC